jgi:uncharacterized coiled-coil protein SlyX
MREQFLEERLVRIEAEIAGLSEIAQARTIASVDMRPRVDRLEGQMRDVVKMVHHLAEMMSESAARSAAPAHAPAPAEPSLEDLNAQIADLRDCVGTLVQLVTSIAESRAAA